MELRHRNCRLVQAGRVQPRFYVGRAAFAAVLALLAGSCSHSKSPTTPSTPPSSSPRTVYVAVSGNNNNDGSIANPWLTLNHAVAQLRPGDTLFMRGGDYTGPSNTIDSELGTVPSGTSWAVPITIAGYSSERVTIRPLNGQQAIRLTASAPHYLIFQDFVIDMINQAVGSNAPDGIYLSGGANHNRFQRLEIRNNAGSAMAFSDQNGNSPFNEVLNCSIHDNGRNPGINSGYGGYIFTSDNLFEGNDIFGNSGFGLHFYNNYGEQNVNRNIIRNNKIHDNGTHGGTNYGIVIAWGSQNTIQTNQVYQNRGGILVYSSDNTLVGNTINGNAPFEGIAIQDTASRTITRDNIVFGNATDISDQGIGTVLSNNHG